MTTVVAKAGQGFRAVVRVTVEANLSSFNPSFEGTYFGTAGAAVVERNEDWSYHGAASIKVTPDGTGTGSMAYPVGMVAGQPDWTYAARLGVVAGQTYTFSVTARVPAVMVGPFSALARRLVVYTRPTGAVLAQSAQAPNTIGDTRLVVTAAIPATGVTDVYVALVAGSSAVADSVLFDALLVQPGTANGNWDQAGAGQTMTLYRIDDTGAAGVVRGLVDVAYASTVASDNDVPLNRDVLYFVELQDGTRFTSAAPVYVWADYPVLSRPITGQAVECAIEEWPELVYTRNSTVLQVPGRRSPVVVAELESEARSSPLLLTFTRAARQALRALVASGDVVLLRTVCPHLDDAYLVLTGRAEQQIGKRENQWRRHPFEAAHISTPDITTRSVGDTLGDLHVAVPGALGDIATRWPGTLLDIADADLMGRG